MPLDLDAIQALAEAASAAVGDEWSWDDGTLIDLCRHESPIGIECTWASGSPAAPHIAQMDPKTTLGLVAELRLAREVVEEYRNNRLHLMRNGIITLPSVTLAAYDKHLEETCHG